ncbi:MAG: peptide chain release factor 2 [Oscillospiraceae bacterium]
MLQFEEQRQKLLEIKPEIDKLSDALGVEILSKQLAELDEAAVAPDFWNDSENSQTVLQKAKQIREKLTAFHRLQKMWQDTLDLNDLANEMADESELPEVLSNIAKLEDDLETQKLATLLTGEYDGNNAILTFHAGAGGTEAQDWAQMLYRMYTRWAERHGYTYKILDYLDGDEAGIKSASILIEGSNVYGYLKSEAGVHRLVRVSPFDSSGRRHTSFASLEVMPEINEDMHVEIDEKDLRIDTYRSSGAGGQHVNKTESAIRITHLPTGIAVACQNERSQRQNREVAMKMLISKLVEIKEREHLERIDDIKGEHKEIGWGSQIRSYVFMPYTMAKDHRTNFEMGNIGAVMDGDLDGFINAYLRDKSLGRLAEV